jgi:hypothetical protein
LGKDNPKQQRGSAIERRGKLSDTKVGKIMVGIDRTTPISANTGFGNIGRGSNNQPSNNNGNARAQDGRPSNDTFVRAEAGLQDAFEYTSSAITTTYSTKDVIRSMAQNAREGKSISGDLREKIAEWSSSGDVRQYNARTQSGNVQETGMFVRSAIGTVGSMKEFTAKSFEGYNPIVTQIQAVSNAIQLIGIDPSGSGSETATIDSAERQELENDPTVRADINDIQTILNESPEEPRALLAIATIAETQTKEAEQDIQAGRQIETQLRQATRSTQPNAGGGGQNA